MLFVIKSDILQLRELDMRLKLHHINLCTSNVKDMDKSNPDRNADVGTGTIDFKNLFTKAKQSGLRNFFIEQETYPTTPMEGTKNSINYLKTIL